MDNNAIKISDVFKRIIFQALEKTDISQFDERKNVYDSALRSLNNVHSQNRTLSDNVKFEQRQILQQLIAEIESKLTSSFDQENNLIDEMPSDFFIDEIDTLPKEGVNIEPTIKPIFKTKISQKFSALKINKKSLILLISVSLFLAALSFFYLNINTQKVSVSRLELPYVINANEELLGTSKTKKNGKVALMKGDEAGILYEVDISGEDNSNRLDFLIRGQLGEQINTIDESVLVTFHIKKISKENIKLNFLFRGSGGIIRKNVEIRDENTNEYFLVTNGSKNDQDRIAVIMRLEVLPEAGKFEEKPALLLKKIVFSKI